jgi:hypothetical protein
MFLFERGDPDKVIGISKDFYQDLLNYDRRAKTPPRTRGWRVPQKVYDEWDALQASLPEETRFGRGRYAYPFKIRTKVLMHIAGLWKDGVIEPTSDTFAGPLIVGKNEDPEDSRDYIFWDCRFLDEQHIVENPYPETPVPPPTYLLSEVEKWEAQNPGSCYSFFKVKSEHLYWLPDLHAGPLFPTIMDPYGRCWKWKKHPKDMPYGESEMHNTLERLRLGPGSMGPGSVHYHTRCRIDTFVTLHRTQEEARREMAVIGTFFRKRPHGSDIDWAGCFLNVDVNFLRNMDKRWWD